LEADFLSLASGFLNIGFPFTVEQSSILYAERDFHEPKRIRLGLFNSEFFRWHFFHFGRGLHCSLGHSADICDCSALLLAGALWLSLFASRPWHYWLGFGVLIATGINFGTIIPAATAVTRWFSRYRGRAMAVTLSASGVAGLFVSRLLNGVLTANGGNWGKDGRLSQAFPCSRPSLLFCL